MKFKLNKNLFKVIYEGIEGYMITDKTLVGIKDWFYYEHFGEDIICQANSNTDLINLSNTTDYFYKIIASTFPLGDLPQFIIKTIIPNSGYKEGMFGYTDTEVRVAQNAFKEGWNKHDEKYKFTEEDMKKAMELGLTLIDGNVHNQERFDRFIQSLSTQRMPSEFIPEYEYKCWCLKPMSGGCFECTKILKTIKNLEGKEEIVGKYQY